MKKQRRVHTATHKYFISMFHWNIICYQCSAKASSRCAICPYEFAWGRILDKYAVVSKIGDKSSLHCVFSFKLNLKLIKSIPFSRFSTV